MSEAEAEPARDKAEGGRREVGRRRREDEGGRERVEGEGGKDMVEGWEEKKGRH